MRLLLDTHAALWAWLEPERLSDDAQHLLAVRDNELLFSQVSTWEICLKYQLGKLSLPEPPETYLPSRVQQLGLTYVPIEDVHLFRSIQLPRFHRDPFDWLLIATAQVLGVPVLTADSNFEAYPIDVVACGR